MDLILVYHRIAGDGTARTPAVSAEHLAQHLEVLKNEAEPATVTELVRDRAVGGSRPRVAITFDDGYVGNATIAWPQLQRFGWPATFFPVSDFLDSRREFWWDELESLLCHASQSASSIELEVNGERRTWASDSETSRSAAFRDLHAMLKERQPDERRTLMAQLAGAMDRRPSPRPERLPMTRGQLQALARDPLVEIGAHTAQHPLLPACPIAVQASEVIRSKRVLEEITGGPVSSFAYPYGRRSEGIEALLESAGFQRAFTVANRPVGQESRFAIPRFSTGDWDGDGFARRFRGIQRRSW